MSPVPMTPSATLRKLRVGLVASGSHRPSSCRVSVCGTRRSRCNTHPSTYCAICGPNMPTARVQMYPSRGMPVATSGSTPAHVLCSHERRQRRAPTWGGIDGSPCLTWGAHVEGSESRTLTEANSSAETVFGHSSTTSATLAARKAEEATRWRTQEVRPLMVESTWTVVISMGLWTGVYTRTLCIPRHFRSATWALRKSFRRTKS